MIEGLLARAGFGLEPGEFRRYGSARRLYNFHIDNVDGYRQDRRRRDRPVRAGHDRATHLAARPSTGAAPLLARSDAYAG